MRHTVSRWKTMSLSEGSIVNATAFAAVSPPRRTWSSVSCNTSPATSGSDSGSTSGDNVTLASVVVRMMSRTTSAMAAGESLSDADWSVMKRSKPICAMPLNSTIDAMTIRSSRTSSSPGRERTSAKKRPSTTFAKSSADAPYSEKGPRARMCLSTTFASSGSSGAPENEFEYDRC